MGTYTLSSGPISFSGSGSKLNYISFSSFYENVAGDVPKYSTINTATLKAYIRETSNKVGSADFYVFFGDDSGNSVHQLYYGNGKIPKNNSSDLEVTLSLKDWVSSNASNAGNLSYSGATRLYFRCQSSLVSRNYQLSFSITYDFTPPTYTIKTVAGTGGKVTDTATYDVTNVDQIKQITATPNAGYKFVKWVDSNGKTYTDKTISVTISQNSISAHSTTVTYTAYFEKIVPPQFTSVSMIYLDKQVSVSNKVIANEGFIITVGVT